MARSIRDPAFFANKQVPQRASTNSLNVEQFDLLNAPRGPRIAPVDVEHVRNLPSLRRAINYSLSHADLDPKEAYGPLEMDKATWSRISTGQQSFPADALLKLRTVTQNDIPLMWLANQLGYELKPLLSELEAKLEAEREGRLAAEHERDYLRRLVLERR